MSKADNSACILRILNDASGHPLLESVLCAQVNARIRPKPTAEEFAQSLHDLSVSARIASMSNDLDDADKYWLLTEKGAAWIMAH